MKKLVLCCALASALFTSDAATKAVVRTSFGEIELELDEAKAPVTVANFVEYAKSGFYDGTIFHRVIDGFMIQGGGFTKEMRQKATRPPIKNEAGNGLGNRKYTIAMARTQVVDSATAQFFINVRDNGFLDHRSEDMAGFGYAVFGTVTKGTDVVDRIARVKTGQVAYFSDVPVEPVVIEKVTVGEKAASADGPAPDYAAYVNPFIGTSGTGHTTPAACAPFGLVQAGPDTGRSGWAYCGGYLWGDKTICGFSQTHINGTGVIELGDLPILPFRGEKPEPQVHDKATETASPGYYAVTFADAKIRTEITARPHTAFYRITYRGDGPRRLLVDCRSVLGGRNHRAAVTPGADGRGLSGTIERRGWVARTYSFAMTFDRPCAKMAELPRGPGERTPRYVFDFDLKPDEALEVRVALSAEGDEAAARRNLEAEAKEVTFDAARAQTRADWNALFARAAAEGDEGAKASFYTSLYHLFVQPNNIADAGAKPFYSTFSCWDSFRSAHPLYTILSPERVPGFVDSMLVQGRRTGFLPVWALWGRDNQCMVGTHSIPVIVDAFFKGLFPEGADPKAVFEQVKETLTKRHPNRNKENWDLLDTYGYYPFDKIRGESVSRTLECVYDDWCAAQFAAKLGRKEDEAFFLRRSGYWKNVFDPKIGFVRGKDTKGNWREPFSPFKLGHGPGTANDFTEGNAFHYTWHVMQDPEGLVAAMGGREAFVRKLDELFSAPEKVAGAGSVLDVTGLIGQYAHGNEPSHHVIYFYTLVGRQDRAAERVREIFDRFYLPKPDGLCGNDDCGAMSAWYVFSAMGFYPFNPCGGEYVLGAPQLPRVTLALPGGKRFAVVAQNLSAKNKYVKVVALNGRPLARPTLRHEEILAGGELVFTMADRP